jgi:hypothetical protein
MKKTITIISIAIAAVACKRDLAQMNAHVVSSRSIEDSLIYLMKRDTLTGTDTIWFNGEPYIVISDLGDCSLREITYDEYKKLLDFIGRN